MTFRHSMGDIVEMLRARKEFGLNGGTWIMLNEPDAMCRVAADEIERLRAVLEDIADADPLEDGAEELSAVARAALSHQQTQDNK